MTNNIKNLLVKEKPFDTLTKLLQEGDWWASKLAMHTSTSRQHCHTIIQEAEKLDLATTNEEKNGKKVVQLTENGQELAQELERLDRVFKEVDN